MARHARMLFDPYNFDGEGCGAAKLGIGAVAATHVRDKAPRHVALEIAPCELDLWHAQ